MKNFEINSNGKFSVDNKTKEFYKMILGGPIFFLSLFFASKYTIDSYGYFIFLVLFLTILYVGVFVIIPITLMLRIKKVVRRIQFKENQIILFTNREYLICRNELKLEEVKNRFTGFSQKNKDGILIRNNDGREYWIIEDFFNDYDELKTLLLDNSKDK